MENQLLDVAGAAAFLSTSERHVRRLVAERRIGFHKVGHFVRFNRSDLELYLEEQHVAALPTSRARGGRRS